MPVPRFVFDQHVNARALRALRDAGVDVVQVAEVGLSDASDPEILAWAASKDRIVVTRNYRDFAPLADAYAKQGRSFPGILFLATSLRQSDVGAHVRVLKGWITEAGTLPDGGSIRNRFGWLR